MPVLSAVVGDSYLRQRGHAPSKCRLDDGRMRAHIFNSGLAHANFTLQQGHKYLHDIFARLHQ